MGSVLWGLIGVGIAVIAAMGIMVRVVGAALDRRYKEGFDFGYKKGLIEGRREANEQYVSRVLMEGKEWSDLAVHKMRISEDEARAVIRRFSKNDDSQ
jgi:hypothetical protein